MAFTPKNRTYQEKAVTFDVEVKESTPESDEEFDFLAPRKDVEKDTLNDVYERETLKKTSYQMTLKTLNALKIVSPIVQAIIETQTNKEGEEERVSTLFKDMVMKISESAVSACEAIGVDSKKEKNAWVRNVFERCIADFVKEQYLKHGNVDTKNVDIIISHLSEISNNYAEKEPYEDLPAESLVSMATIRAMLPIVSESMNNFDFHRKLENDLENIVNFIGKECEKATEVLASDYASEKNRAQLYFLLMQEAGILYASCWKAESTRIRGILHNNPTEKVLQSFEKFKSTGGFPLSKIEQSFSIFFQRFVVISQKLSLAERRSNLAGRLKKK